LMPDMSGVTRLTRLGDYPKNLKHFGQSDLLVTNTPGIAERCKALGWEKPVKVISNFVRQVDVTPVDRARFDTPRDAFLVGGSGRFVPRKGFDAILRAVARLPDAWLWIAGTGELEAELRQLAEELGVSGRTRFLGWLDEPMHAMAACDTYLMASRHEPLGNVVLEAWHAAGAGHLHPVRGAKLVRHRRARRADGRYRRRGPDGRGAAPAEGRPGPAPAPARRRACHAERRFTRDSIAEQYLAVFRSGA
jgi:hypothetical protein